VFDSHTLPPLQVNLMADVISHLNQIPADRPVLVFDGDCGFCNRSVQFVLNHEKRRDLLFLRRASELGMELRRHFGLESVESMLWVENGIAYVESDATLKTAAYVGGWCRLALVARVVPRPLRNWAYRIFARNRHRIFAARKQCVMPDPEQKSRFLS